MSYVYTKDPVLNALYVATRKNAWSELAIGIPHQLPPRWIDPDQAEDFPGHAAGVIGKMIDWTGHQRHAVAGLIDDLIDEMIDSDSSLRRSQVVDSIRASY